MPAAISGFQVFLTVALTIPIIAAINWFFDGEARINLKGTFAVGGVLAAGWTLITLVTSFIDAHRNDRIVGATHQVFRPTTFVFGLFTVAALGSLAMMIGANAQNEPIWLQLLPLVFLALTFYGWPRTIHCEETTLSQRNLWGRKYTIPYAEIEAISVSGDGAITVLGSGATIQHTQYHINPDGFAALVSGRSGKPVY